MQIIDEQKLIDLVESVGAELLEMSAYGVGDIQVKADLSPIVEADVMSNSQLRYGLMELYPEIPIISEESEVESYRERSKWEYCWILDPLDGTREFILRNGRFCINLALIHKGECILGMIYSVVDKELLWTSADKVVHRRVNGVEMPLAPAQPREHITVAISRFDMIEAEFQYIDFLRENGLSVEMVPLGAAIKQLDMAKGEIDLHVKLGHTYEWDIAAGDCLIKNSGGVMRSYPTMEPLTYNKKSMDNPPLIMMSKRLFEMYNNGLSILTEFKLKAK
ncbi:MAG: 3'(2'),5'-bisphosphate nucleotidase CysQ family protein [Marinifilaceae bacterium]